MNKKYMCLMMGILLMAASVQGCAGGSRGTGIRFNSDTKSSPLDDDDDDDDKPLQYHRR